MGEWVHGRQKVVVVVTLAVAPLDLMARLVTSLVVAVVLVIVVVLPLPPFLEGIDKWAAKVGLGSLALHVDGAVP